MFLVRLQGHEVHHVHHSHPQFRQVGAQQAHGRKSLQRRDISCAGHHHVGLAPRIVPGPLEDADSRRAVLDRRVDVEPLGLRLLARDDDVDEIAARQALACDTQQGVGIRRQIDAHEVCLLVDHEIDEARILVGEAVVILPPHMGREQYVERGDRAPPGDAARRLQPLGVLVEHRVHDVNERLVTGEQPVPAGQQVALEPPLALVLGQNLHDTPIGPQIRITGARLGIPRAAGLLEDGIEPVRSSLIRPEHTEVAGVRVHLEHIA